MFRINVICVIVLFVTVATASDSSEGSEVSRKIHKYPYGPYGHYGIFLHTAFGVVAVLVIIKIILAMVFVGMVTGLLHMFAGIKYLLKINELKQVVVPHEHEHEHDHFSIPTIYQDHESFHGFESTGPGPEYSEHHPYKRRGDLDGARRFGFDSSLVTNSKESIHQRRKRSSLKKDSGSNILTRIIRSVESENENCKKKTICELHAKAKKGPFQAFQLYFVKKDGLAKYWDHDENRKFSDCARDFPCDTKEPAKKDIDSKAPTEKQQTRPPTARSLTADDRQYNEYGTDYSSQEYETEPIYQPYSGYTSYDYSQSY